MILGVDHLARSCSNLQQTVEEFKSAGFDIQFMETSLPNHPSKKEFLHHYYPDHGIAYAKPKKGPGIELTCHGADLSNEQKIYEPFIGDHASAFDVLVVRVANLKSSFQFWKQALGLAISSKSDEGSITGSFLSPVPSWSLCIRLQAVKEQSKRTYLDDVGFTCLALITNDLHGDRLRLEKYGAKSSSESFAMVVNGKILNIGVFRGPSDELVELIEITRK